MKNYRLLPKFTKLPIPIGESIHLFVNGIGLYSARHVSSNEKCNAFTAEVITSYFIHAVPVNSPDNIYLIFNGEKP